MEVEDETEEDEAEDMQMRNTKAEVSQPETRQSDGQKFL
jgi:hypothetical protein